jgi:hypothetical protein
MADKAKLLADIIFKVLESPNQNTDYNLTSQKKALQSIINNITNKQFSDIYAQTITYGLLAGCLHRKNTDNFSVEEPYSIIPPSTPFFKDFFGNILGLNTGSRIKWIVDDLLNMFNHTNIGKIAEDFGRLTESQDPIINFMRFF